MLKPLLLVSLLALPAAAQPAPPTPPGPPPPGSTPKTCKADGAVLLETDTNMLTPNQVGQGGTMVSRLFASGAFERHVRTDRGEIQSLVSGSACVDDKELARVKKELAAAKFVLRHDAVACDAISNDFTTYVVNGTPVFTDRMCNHDYLDPASKAALDDAAGVLARYTTDPITNSRGKPVK